MLIHFLLLALAAVRSTAKLSALLADQVMFSEIDFDYLIVGGGTGGIALATRLSENSSLTIGVLEAGLYHLDEPLIETPSRFGQGIGSDIDWGYLSVPQPSLNNMSVLMSSGKMVGGSSGLNFIAFTRASKPEYDAWETLGNGPTWNWDSLLPYFRKSETFTPPPPQGVFPGAVNLSTEDMSQAHGDSGPVHASYNEVYGDVIFPAVQAMNEFGVPTNSDPANGNGVGVFNLCSAVDRSKGIRSYGGNSYFGLSNNRTNLHVLTNAHANKVVFGNSTGNLVATGVEFTFNGQPFTASARREVILSAGTMQTPKILELSGIGGQQLLSSLGIETLIDMPQVGENLQDQPIIGRDFLLRPNVFGSDLLRNNLTFALQQLRQYETSNTGLFATTVPAVAFPSFPSIVPDGFEEKIKELNATLVSELANTTISPLYAAQLALQLDWLSREDVAHGEFIIYDGGGMSPTPPAVGSSYLSLTSGLMHTFGRGTVHINSTDHLQLPVINPHFLELTIDSASFEIFGNFTDSIASLQPLAPFIEKASTPPNTTDFLGYTRQNLQTIHHYVGTAALAPKESGGVVDPTLKVYGTSNLRIVDASIIPLQIATHTQATVYAIAERAADMITSGL